VEILEQPTLQIQGGLLTYHRPQSGRTGGGIRRPCTFFTNASRRNYMRKLACTDWRLLVARGTPLLFLTLTSTPEYWGNTRRLKKGLAAVERWLYTQGVYAFTWKREIGELRGMEHYHLLTLGAATLDAVELARVWSKALRYEPAGRPEQYLRVDVKQAETPEIAARYLCKYVSKMVWEGSRAAGGCAPRGARDCHLFKSQNSTELEKVPQNGPENSHTGTRWWGFSSSWPFADAVVFPFHELKATDSQLTLHKFVARVRRMFRKWRISVERRSLERKLRKSFTHGSSKGEDAISRFDGEFRAFIERRLVEEAARQLAKFKRRGLAWARGPAGFALMMDPNLLSQMMVAAIAQETITDADGVVRSASYVSDFGGSSECGPVALPSRRAA